MIKRQNTRLETFYFFIWINVLLLSHFKSFIRNTKTLYTLCTFNSFMSTLNIQRLIFYWIRVCRNFVDKLTLKIHWNTRYQIHLHPNVLVRCHYHSWYTLLQSIPSRYFILVITVPCASNTRGVSRRGSLAPIALCFNLVPIYVLVN